ncbi:hypothetical protein F900_01066 [Acinetobacter modestus]|uniref:Uncharacterized protein n=1 Tax=Acinetobacter modestus TaxID=1776740 RepID=N9NKV9_9GAMM|nr:hypothetical protein [Acinetobacter modestus]ENX02620.1 hypothetical protein F900_01066 [Acinetobacter modestus]
MGRKINLLNLSLSCFILSQSTHAGLFDSEQDVEVTVQGKVMADLGPETRQLFNKLPENIKDNVVKGIQESMPIIDKSVMKYIDRIDLSIKNSMENSHDPIICTSNGVSKNLLETLKDALFGSRPIPIAKVYNDYNQLGLLELDKDPLFYKVKYADFLGNATRVECQFLNGRTEKLQVIEFRQRIDYRWKIWNDLDGKCLNSYKCYDFAKDKLNLFIRNSDPRDLKQGDFDALTLYNRLPDPNLYTPSKINKSVFNEIERNIIEAVKIYDAITLIRLNRIEKEDELNKQIVSKLNESKNEFEKYLKKSNTAFDNRGTNLQTLTAALSQIRESINKNNLLIEIISKLSIENPDTLNIYNQLRESITQDNVDLSSKLKQIELEISRVPPPSKPGDGDDYDPIPEKDSCPWQICT